MGDTMKGLNLGSGQRRFETVEGVMEWVNVDCVSRPPDQVPDVIADARQLPRDTFPDCSVDVVVLHHVLEHFGLGEGDGVIREAYRVLKPGGSLIVTVPDLKALARRWMLGQISDYIYCVQLFGAFQGEEGDRHKWGFTHHTLRTTVAGALGDGQAWSTVGDFELRQTPGADISRDWYIIGVEAIK